MTLILASASPRRRELLRAAGMTFKVKATNIPEPSEALPSIGAEISSEQALKNYAKPTLNSDSREPAWFWQIHSDIWGPRRS